MRSFLGLAGYYRKFIPRFAEIAVPLSDLTKKGSPMELEWTHDCEEAFETLAQEEVTVRSSTESTRFPTAIYSTN